MARKLSTFEKDQLIAWFLNFMPMEQRGKLMGEMPVTYQLLFPTATTEIIAGHAETACREALAQQTGS
jgi:hypothetical protein